MLDGLLGRGFTSKCKELIKQTRKRIDASRRNKDARQRIMKKDIADLLANGLDINAFGRVKQTEEYFAGLCLVFCYHFIEGSCEFILKQLSLMQKQSECPGECREAVASLMFAAARFSDLPELRDLREMFQERYGNSLEYFVNQKFVEKVASKPPTMEKKLQILQDIASEFSIMWDSRGFEQRMATPSAFTQDQPWKYRPLQETDDKHRLPNGKATLPRTHKPGVSSKEKLEPVNDNHRIHNGLEGNVLRDQLDYQFVGRQGLTNNEYKPHASRENNVPRRDKRDIPIQVRQDFSVDKHEKLNVKDTTPKAVRSGSSSHGKDAEYIDGGYKRQNDRINIASIRSHEKLEAAISSVRPHVKSEVKDYSSSSYNQREQHNIASSERNAQKEEIDGSKSNNSNALPPPPYVKSKDKVIPPPYVKLPDSKYDAIWSKNSSSNCDGASMDPSSHNRENPMNKSERSQVESVPNYEGQVVGPGRVDRHDYDREHHFPYDMPLPLPKPRSVRRKHSKSSSSQGDFGNVEDTGVVKRSSSSSRRRENSRRGLQDEEEKRIDKLLLHYSKKPSNYEHEKVKKKSKAHPSDHGDFLQYRSQDVPDAETEAIPPPSRSVSLPREQTAPTEPKKIFARANSFQPDNQAPHVHPKLPDYDDLAARFAALRGQ